MRMNVCVFVELVHEKTTERIGMKFGTEVDYSLEEHKNIGRRFPWDIF